MENKLQIFQNPKFEELPSETSTWCAYVFVLQMNAHLQIGVSRDIRKNLKRIRCAAQAMDASIGCLAVSPFCTNAQEIRMNVLKQFANYRQGDKNILHANFNDVVSYLDSLEYLDESIRKEEKAAQGIAAIKKALGYGGFQNEY